MISGLRVSIIQAIGGPRQPAKLCRGREDPILISRELSCLLPLFKDCEHLRVNEKRAAGVDGLGFAYPLPHNSTFAIDTRGYQCLNTMFMINVHAAYDRYFTLGILNSTLIRGFWIDRFFDQRRTFPKIKGTYLEQLPIFSKDAPSAADKKRIGTISEMARALVRLNGDLRASNSEQHKRAFQRQVDAAEQRINRALYELYELESNEIERIEKLAKNAAVDGDPGQEVILEAVGPLEVESVPKPKKFKRRRRAGARDTEQSALF
jgi:hypothetical protein